MLDLLIRNGRVIDGTGNPWYRADVGIRGNHIAGLGRLDREAATRTIDADGLAVCPGFVDMHTHSDLALLAEPTWECKVMQGVTLEVLGQDGLGLAPVTDATREVLHQQLMAGTAPGRASPGIGPRSASTWPASTAASHRTSRCSSPMAPSVWRCSGSTTGRRAPRSWRACRPW